MICFLWEKMINFSRDILLKEAPRLIFQEKRTGMRNPEKRTKLNILDISLLALMTAIIEVSKIALSGLPNLELVSFWIIMFTLFFGPKVIYSILVFILIEIFLYGIHVWVIMYLYVWPLLVILTRLLRKQKSAIIYAVMSGTYGLLFGALCAIPYIFIGTFDGNSQSGFVMAFNWWIAGIPYDITHGIANFVIMMVLYHPIYAVMKQVSRHLPHSVTTEEVRR